MTTDDKKSNENDLDKNENQKSSDEDPAVQRGKLAIATQQKIDSDPEDVKKAKEEEDAENWRNEG